MKVYVVGNPLIKEDSLPLKLLPKLRKEFPNVVFEEGDPNENFIPEDGSVIIDTVQGIKDVQWFEDIEDFFRTRSVSSHDYDLGLHLRLLQKLKKVKKIKILGIPQTIKERTVVNRIIYLLRELQKQKSNDFYRFTLQIEDDLEVIEKSGLSENDGCFRR